jgi:TRAP-type uncharacterized transport system fused permease subunit
MLRPLAGWQRAVAIAAALLLVAPELTTDILGLSLAAAMLLYQHFAPSAAKLGPVGAAAAADRAGDRHR